ncbi:hypothetical protein PVK06_007824 [Gossypium arboreum]|uniref:Reverse transcriptase n=1 Tax=Gossypium arboreum TaxID=29729 RepID=A0ABR0QIB9_GOSAR|nr:hypothetical protein PVK06_007824 [Gossypium arboreum]
MGPTKALGENSFPALFYHKYWHIVGEEVTSFCLRILNGDMEVNALISTKNASEEDRSLVVNLLGVRNSNELERYLSIVARFWWQKGHGKKGIHWCTWKNLCALKENGGLGFRNFGHFNIALLDKQGVAQKILQIPLAETDHEDTQVWKGELSGGFSFVHEGKNTTGRDLAQNIQKHMAEYEVVRAMKRPVNMNRNYRTQEYIPRMTIYFDAMFDSRNFISATSLVVWDLTGKLLALKTTIHNNISSPFTSEAYACLEGTKLGISLGLQWRDDGQVTQIEEAFEGN